MWKFWRRVQICGVSEDAWNAGSLSSEDIRQVDPSGDRKGGCEERSFRTMGIAPRMTTSVVFGFLVIFELNQGAEGEGALFRNVIFD